MNKIVEQLNNEVWVTLVPSRIHGIGVIAIRNIPRGTHITKYTNELMFVEDDDFKSILEPIRNMILDRTVFYEKYGIQFRHPNSLARLQCFMNHSDTPNTDGEIALIDIKEGEEITEDFISLGFPMHKFTIERYKPFIKILNGTQ